VMNYSPAQMRKNQKGVSLILVLIVLLLTLTTLLAAFRVSLLNEALVGNSSDYSRAQAAAEALIRDAEIDIRGRRPPYTTVQADGQLGWPCRPVVGEGGDTNVEMVGYESSCRLRNSAVAPWFPQSNEEFDSISDIVVSSNATSRCMNAICVPLNINSHAGIGSQPDTWMAFGATYGKYTRNSLASPGGAGNPILNGENPRAWYWIEVFRYSEVATIGADIANKLVPSRERNFIYRITAVAKGLRPGTKVVIRSIFVPYPQDQSQ
jgi:type IV pilus assembly protein PilX